MKLLALEDNCQNRSQNHYSIAPSTVQKWFHIKFNTIDNALQYGSFQNKVITAGAILL